MSQLNFQINIFNQSNVEYILHESEPWFKAKQIAEILEYKDTKRAIQLHVDNEDKQPLKSLCQGRQNVPPHLLDTLMINESGLYSLVLRSKKPEAKRFKRWVTSEVLPAIRQTGKYENEQLKLKLEQANKTIEWFTEHQTVEDSWFQRLPPKEPMFIPKKLTNKEIKLRIHKDMLPFLNNPHDYIYIPKDI